MLRDESVSQAASARQCRNISTSEARDGYQDQQQGVQPGHERREEGPARGPVYITDRGRPAHVLLAYEDYERLLGTKHILDRLAEPAGVEDIELILPTSGEFARPADFS